MSRARLAKALLSVLLAATAGVMARFARRNREPVPRGAASTPSGGGANQNSDKAEKSKRAVSDYVVVGGLVVSIATLAFNQLRTSQELGNAQQQIQLTQQGQFSERYAHAIEELGSERLPIRLTGIYELEQVALGSPEHYPLGMEILADYLRSVSLVPRGAGAGTPEPPDAAETAEIRAVLKVLGRRPKDREPVRLDLSGVNLRGLDLSEANLSGADFSGADFEGADFSGVLEVVDLSGVRLDEANLTGADLHGATLTGADLRGTDLRGVENLTQEQLEAAVIDESTTFPPELATPEPPSSPTP